MDIHIEPSGEACGATVTGLDLSKGLDRRSIGLLRAAWLTHHVLVFPEQKLDNCALEQFTLYFGPFGEDPFITPIPGHPHIIAVHRAADETEPVFADVWHTDWSFQAQPPQGTCLYGIDIPPVGGDTLFANQHLALEKMPAGLRAELEGQYAIHSAILGYSPDGLYGSDATAGRAMEFLPSDAAYAQETHAIIRKHEETGREGLFGTLGYIVGIEGMDDEPALRLLSDMHSWQTREEFQYRHVWQPDMLIMWDNRSVLHRASDGYDGYKRLLHRTTIGHA